MLSFFPRGVLDEILNLIELVSEGFLPTLECFLSMFTALLQDFKNKNCVGDEKKDELSQVS